MKNLIASVMAGSLVLMAALPAAGHAARLVDSNGSVNSANDRGTYVQGARREVEEWRQKLYDFSDSARSKAIEANKAAWDDLTQAWTRTEAASLRLENAGADDCQIAKSSYRTASHKLVLAWRKVSPTGK